jgi:outer membrane protein TolC
MFRRRLFPVLVLALLALPLAACHGPDGAGAGPACGPIYAEGAVDVTSPPPVALPPPGPEACDRPLPINLPTALQLAGARPLDVGLAAERIEAAAADLRRAHVLALPSILVGADYFRHDGQLQDVAGNILGTSKSALLAGFAPTAIFAVTDAIFAPLAARQVVRAREAELQAARNDALLAVAEAYFNVQQARGELAGAIDAARRADEVAEKVDGVIKSGLAPPVEGARVRAEAARRRQAIQLARERWRTASAELNRVLRLEPTTLVEPLEPPHLRITLVGGEWPADELVAVALQERPEGAARQALVQASEEQVRQEKMRPLLPSVLLRGAATNPAGTLSSGVFGGGINDRIGNFSFRNDMDLQLLWELQNLGFGNRARVQGRAAEKRLADLELLRTQDRIAAEVATALAQVRSAEARLKDAEDGLRDAARSASENYEGMGKTQGAGANLRLIIRPLEVVAAVQSLAQAYTDYYAAVADFDRAQFRLYRAIGQPAQRLGLPCGPNVVSVSEKPH